MKTVNTVILLTACIQPKGMPFTILNNPTERQKQYEEALAFYLSTAPFPIVCCENTGIDLAPQFQEAITQGRLEYLTFDGNRFDKQKGKGYGEMEIIEYAFTNSHLIAQATEVFKITGRLKLLNLKALSRCHRWFSPPSTIQVYEIKNEASFADSRFIWAPKAFFSEYLIPRKEELDDSRHFWMEHLLYAAAASQSRMHVQSFPVIPSIKGTSGSDGRNYERKYYLRDRLKRAQDAFCLHPVIGRRLPHVWRILYGLLNSTVRILLKLLYLTRR